MLDEGFPDALPGGHRLHWYVLDHVLGQGGFGITYLARDTNLDRLVAIKEYLPAEIARRRSDATAHPRTVSHAERFAWGLDRFLAEARTLARFDHPNIVRVHSVFEANNTAYMVMRFEEGESLAARLGRSDTLGEADLTRILLPILDGLQLIHAAGFIHRDIKPDNIYLRADGSPVLLDFGSARQSFGRARTMTILVAPGYAPLEQYYGEAAAQGAWTDIYSLAATCYRAITGRPPLDAVARAKGVLGSAREVLPSATDLGRGRYSTHLLAAVDHALQLGEQDRPQSIAEWRRELVVVPQPAVPVLVSADAAVPARPPAVPKAIGPAVPPTTPRSAAPPNPPPAGPPRRTWLTWLGLPLLGAAVGVLAVLFHNDRAGREDSHRAGAEPAPVQPAASTVAAAVPTASSDMPATHQRPRANTPPNSAGSVSPPTPGTRQGSPATSKASLPPVYAGEPVKVPTDPGAASQAAIAGAAASAASAASASSAPMPSPPGLLASTTAPPRSAQDKGTRSDRDDQIDAAAAALRRGDPAAAARLLAPWAASGVTRAQLLLGRAQELRVDRQHSDNEAYMWYAAAARGGDPDAPALRDAVATRLQPAEIRQANRAVDQLPSRIDARSAANP
jgi:serine/threonine protein kinase